MSDEPRRQWTGLDLTQELTPDLQAARMAQWDRDVAFAQRSHTHLWTVIVTHRAGDAFLDAMSDPDQTPLLDAESIAMAPMVGCYVCEEPFSPTIRRRKCPGQPRYMALPGRVTK